MGSLKLRTSLLSGRCETISVSQSGTVGDLKKAVHESLGRRFLRLAAPDGRLLDDPTEPLALLGLRDGDEITAIAQQPKVATTEQAFALWCGAGHQVVCWGNPAYAGDSSRVQDQLRNVQQICATDSAFAAMLPKESAQQQRSAAAAHHVAKQIGAHGPTLVKQGRAIADSAHPKQGEPRRLGVSHGRPEEATSPHRVHVQHQLRCCGHKAPKFFQRIVTKLADFEVPWLQGHRVEVLCCSALLVVAGVVLSMASLVGGLSRGALLEHLSWITLESPEEQRFLGMRFVCIAEGTLLSPAFNPDWSGAVAPRWGAGGLCQTFR
eukprot:Skav225775  [mRNA]  locus=scaffold1577:69193:77606:+ [translate_table: standard]